MPLANSTHGAVIETLDLFRSDRWSTDAFIRDEITLKIEHCFFVASSTNGEDGQENIDAIMESIVCVYSHEQALGQCAGWLDRHVPRATRVKTDSTAAAGERILNARTGGQMTKVREAAICPETCLWTQVGLRLVKKGIQDRQGVFPIFTSNRGWCSHVHTDNQTRFVVVSYHPIMPFPLQGKPAAIKSRTIIRISPKTDGFGKVLSLLSSTTFTLQRIDHRPALEGETWSDVYFVELSWDAASALEDSLPSLVRSVREYADVTTLGTW
jgi:prephenate dehydratase